MKFYESAQAIGDKLIDAFATGNVGKAMAHTFIQAGRYCDTWSFTNRLMVALAGYSDARTYKGWQSVGRQVKKGEKGFYVLEPVLVKQESEDGEERRIMVGVKGGVRFGLEQTEGDDYPLEATEHIESLPLLEVAQRWGLDVRTYKGEGSGAAGYYVHGKAIALGVTNLSTWAHELLHAADDKLGNLKEKGQHWMSESVAELGGCILLNMIGKTEDADMGGAYEYVKHYATEVGLTPAEACMKVLDRTCAAITLIMEESEKVTA